MTSLAWTRSSNEELNPEVIKVSISANEELVFNEKVMMLTANSSIRVSAHILIDLYIIYSSCCFSYCR